MFFKLVDSCEGARYKKGDTVVIKKGEAWDGTSLKGKFVKILGVRVWFNGVTTYKIDHDSDYGLEDEEIDHEATERLKEEGSDKYKLIDSHALLKYKKGDKVVVAKGVEYGEFNISEKVVEIVGIRDWGYCSFDYKININPRLCLQDYDINHEATERLNAPINLLENGCVVEFRNGERALVLKGGGLYTEVYGNQDLCFVFRDGFEVGSNYDESLKRIDNDGFRIDKIYKRDICGFWFMLEEEDGMELIWQRPEHKPYKVSASEILRLLNLKEGTKIEIDLER